MGNISSGCALERQWREVITSTRGVEDITDPAGRRSRAYGVLGAPGSPSEEARPPPEPRWRWTPPRGAWRDGRLYAPARLDLLECWKESGPPLPRPLQDRRVLRELCGSSPARGAWRHARLCERPALESRRDMLRAVSVASATSDRIHTAGQTGRPSQGCPRAEEHFVQELALDPDTVPCLQLLCGLYNRGDWLKAAQLIRRS